MFYQADPYEVGGMYDRFSPITHVAKAQTPTLIVHGEQDWIVPIGQAYEFFRGLKEHGVPVQLAVYPREGHSFREQAHILDLIRRYSDWFERYMKQ